jgi:ribonucleoside-triphosphate reductase
VHPAQSIKTTTVKPSGTVSILAGESPGVHWAPGGEFFDRAMRLAKDDPMVALLRQAGYTIETDVADPDQTVVCYFPIHARPSGRAGRDAVREGEPRRRLAQRYWSTTPCR